MKLLVIGSGGREHALVWKLAQSPHATRLWCAPGNAGIAGERCARNGAAVECVPLGAQDVPGLLAFAREQRPDLTVVGPDNPLAMGIVDRFMEHGLRVFGPTRQAAQFESSKAFAQGFMERHGIPTARAGTFRELAPASRFAASLGGRCAVKADGLALGKGVILCRDMAQADAALEEILVKKAFGAAGAAVVIQELLAGVELSLHALCDGRTARLFPTSQDHKAALDGDRGPNTGGMGTYSPAPFLTETELAAAREQIIDPWLRGCAAEGIDYRGVLYPGLMLTRDGPRVLEFNARFGDPETQVYLPRLETDLLEVLDACARGSLAALALSWRPVSAVCVVMASAGYPGPYAKGQPISGLDAAGALPDTKVFHAGTVRSGDRICTSGGRVLGVTAWGVSLEEARDKAYAAVEKIKFDGAQYRRDIAAKALGLGKPDTPA
ncbi:MAG: phosphoribosylamine--glycine ligase [Verrucomicrobia bacterium]|nr:phosphoribosylamine--glycine ligase [Verrucomicrobiota bacterium]